MNRAACQAAPRVREPQNLRVSLLNSLLAGKWCTEKGLLETASTTKKSQGSCDLGLFRPNCPISPPKK